MSPLTHSAPSHYNPLLYVMILKFLDPYDGSSEDSDECHYTAGLLARRPRQHGYVCNHFLCRSRRFVTLQPPTSAPVEVTKREPEPRPPSTSTSTTTTTSTATPGTLPLQQPEDVQMDSGGSSSERWVSPWSSLSDRSGHRGPAGTTGSGHVCPEREDDRFEDSGLHDSTIRSPTPPASARSPPPPPPHPPPPRTAVSEGGSPFPGPSGSSKRSPGPSSDGCFLYKRKMMGLQGMEAVESGHRKKQCVVSMKEEPQ